MYRNALLIGAIAAGSLALGGCHLYFGEGDRGNNDNFYCDNSGCYTCDDWGCYPSGDGDGGPGWTCSNNYECAAGCYCSADGFCEEAGFCTEDYECPDGFECDDRSSCVPEGSSEGCTADAQCPTGSYCDEEAGFCVGSWTCDNASPDADDYCGMGWECDDRNTCIPQPCTSDDQCELGCYCDEDIGECIETSTCDGEDDCPGDLTCDLSRSTCVPGPALTCESQVTCGDTAPICPDGTRAVIENGCYTGACMAVADCPDDVTPLCSDHNPAAGGTALSCSGDAAIDCQPVYNGINCTDPQGNTCDSGSNNCTCESFVYAHCDPVQ